LSIFFYINRILLDELCNHNDFFTLDNKINYYLQAQDTVELYVKLLERAESDFNSLGS